MEPGVEEVYVISNFVRESIVGGGKLPVMCRYIYSSNINKLNIGFGMNYMPLKNIETDVIEIKVLNGKNMNPVHFKPGILYCTFHFIDV